MKITTFALVYFCLLICSKGFTQSIPTNLSCESASIMCDQFFNQTYDYTSDTTLCGDPVYFTFYTLGNPGSLNVFNSSYPSSGNLKLYGPFNSNDPLECNFSAFPSLLVADITFDNTSGNGGGFGIASAGWYKMVLQFDSCYVDPNSSYLNGIQIVFKSIPVCEEASLVPCQDCITSFSPTPGKYLVSAWVKEEGASMNTTTYANSSITVSFTGDPYTETLLPSGQIIDGWQRVEGIIEVPLPATDIHLSFETSSGTSYYDDIRFHPLDGSMMSYVYDPISLRLMAELDERNYATLYEYDEEGKLIRVKKETEKGIMTIQENRDNITKQ